MKNKKIDITQQDIKNLSRIKKDLFVNYDLLKTEFENDDNISQSICERLYGFGKTLGLLSEVHVLKLMSKEEDYRLSEYAKEYMSLSDTNVVDITKGHIFRVITLNIFLGHIPKSMHDYFPSLYRLLKFDDAPIEDMKTAHKAMTKSLWNDKCMTETTENQRELIFKLESGLHATTIWSLDIFKRNNPQYMEEFILKRDRIMAKQTKTKIK